MTYIENTTWKKAQKKNTSYMGNNECVCKGG